MKVTLVVPADYSPDYISPGHLRKVHREGPDEHNADLVFVENGIEVGRVPYRRMLANALDAKLPKVPVTERVEGKERKKVLGEPSPPEIRRGAPPLYQLLYKKCDWERGLKMSEILKLVDDLRWFRDVGTETRLLVTGALKDMIGKQLITWNKAEGKYHAGPRRLSSVYEMGEGGHTIEDNYHPVVRLIRDAVSKKGRMRVRNLVDLIHDDWNYATSREVAENWIGFCLKQGYLREIKTGVVEAWRFLA